MKRAVLLVTNEQDVGADFVVADAARRQVPVVRLNTERLPSWRLELRPGDGWRLSRGERALDNAQTAGVWWRRPEPPPRPSSATPEEWNAVVSQWRALTEGLASVPGPRWVSDPPAIRAAEDKARQLQHAAAVGFATPATLWTNDVDAAAAHVEASAPAAIVKSVSTAYWEQGQQSSFVFARRLMRDQLPGADSLALAPLAFQCAVAPKRDVRVTVIGERTFAAVCEDSPHGDWRLASETTWKPYELPNLERQRCVELASSFGLAFAGIDLLVDAHEQHWFLELNPNGEWGWLQHQVGLPLATALVDVLSRCPE